MCDGIKINLESIVQFLSKHNVSGYTKQELMDECADCLAVLRGRVVGQRPDKGGGTFVDHQAAEAFPVVELVLKDLREGRDDDARSGANRALTILAGWQG